MPISSLNSYRFVWHRTAPTAPEGASFGSKGIVCLVEEDLPLPQILKAIDAVFDPHRTVRSSASKELANIRSSLGKKRTAADRIFYRVRQPRL